VVIPRHSDRAPCQPDIAIVGIGCRLPGGIGDLDGLWRLLLDGADVTRPVTPDRVGVEQFPPGHVGGFLDEIDRFDAAFFGVSPREAREIDPQQRLLLEVAWSALEHSGTPRERWEASRTGVYVGILAMDYALLHARTLGPERIDKYYAGGKEFSFAAGRIAYTFGLHGPVMALNTACSSSLIAVHLAAAALRSGECDAALAGGVNLLVGPELSRFMREIQALSRTSQCRPFDAAADGVVRGEGCGLVVLKRYADAVADGDRIWAVIRGGAVNHDGRSAGLTAPNPTAQTALLRDALRAAGTDPADVDYVESHSTGTPLGDPIELSALAAVYGVARPPGRPLLIGSHKANFGHLDSAAGILGLLKALLVINHGLVPPQIKLERPTTQIDWTRSGLQVATAATPIGERPGGYVAGVSAFGLSGTNAHILLASPPHPAAAADDTTDDTAGGAVIQPVLTLSAPKPDGLRAQADAYRQLLRAEPGAPLADLIYSAAARRTHHPFRLAVTARTRSGLVAALDDHLAGKRVPGAVGDLLDAGRLAVVHVFSGQGAQWPGMGLDLDRRSPVVRDTLDECDALLRRIAGWSLRAELARTQDSRLSSTEFAQPAVFAVQLGLSRLWTSWGAAPDAVVGHSMGEVAAACVAGTLDLADAVRLIVHRARLMQAATGSGRMVAVELGADEVSVVLSRYDGEICIATVNGPRSVVVAGPATPLDEVVARLRASGATCVPLGVDYAFHSPAVHRHGDELTQVLADLPTRTPHIPLLSTVEPEMDSPRLDARYWGRNVRETVRFWPAVDRFLARQDAAFVELGPHPGLVRALRAALAHRDRRGVAVGSLARGKAAPETLADAVARLHVAGVPLDWSAVSGAQRRYLPLPPVPLDGERYWLASAEPAAPPTPSPAGGPPAADGRAPDGRAPDGRAPDGRAPDGRAAGGPGNGAVTKPSGREGLARMVADAAAQALGYAGPQRIARTRGFFELGMDSLTLVEFTQGLARQLGCRLDAAAAIQHPTVDQLTDHILATAPLDHGHAAPASRSPARGEPSDEGAIAVVGLGCRLPGADGPDAFWRLLRDGVDATTDIPADRWDNAALYADGPATPGTVVTRRGAFLDRIDLFDNAFFRVSAREARGMDPQQRLFLEVAWEAIDDAGLDAAALSRESVGVFVGLNTTDYQQLVTRHPRDVDLYYGTGNSFSAAAGRLSYFLGLRGPSLAVDAACASSLVAVHLASQSLLRGESAVALAGGANVMSTPTVYLSMSAAGALAPDGRCKTFDARADGYGRGEGVGVVVLKTLAAARAAGDRVYAVIRGSAVNHNGASGGLTVPSPEAQEQLIQAVLAGSGQAPAAVDYVEAHGTGTRLGDAAELVALAQALGPGRAPTRPLLVGSVKTNIGHLEAAAGIAGLIKTVLALWHGEIPPHLHLTSRTEQVPWDRLPIAVPTRRTPWPRPEGRPRAAGVSAFGFTGTNAHVLLTEAPGLSTVDIRGPARSDRPHLLTLSAATEPALKAAAQRMVDRLAEADEVELANICFTAAARRTHHEYRLAVVGRTRRELIEALALPDGGTEPPGRRTGTARPGEPSGVAAFFGTRVAVAPWRELDRDEPAFRAALDDIDRVAAPLGRSGRTDLLAAGPATTDPLAVLASQLVTTALWRDHGVGLDAVVGYGTGELAAAHVAGLLDLADAVRAACGDATVRLAGNAAIPAHLASLQAPAGLDNVTDWTPAEVGRARPGWVASSLADAGLRALLDVGGDPAAAEVAAGCPGLTAAELDAATPTGRLTTVAALHVSGSTVDWDRLFGQRRQVVSLARYAWQRRRHWIDGSVGQPPAPADTRPTGSGSAGIPSAGSGSAASAGRAGSAGNGSADAGTDGHARGAGTHASAGTDGHAGSVGAGPDDGGHRLAGRMFTVSWEPVPIPAAAPAAGGRWLVLPVATEAAGPAARLAGALRARGAEVTAAPATAGRTLPALLRDRYAGLVLVSAVDPHTRRSAAAATEQSTAVLAAARELSGAGSATHGTRLWIVTVDAQQPTGTAAPSAAPAAVWGLGRVLAMELAQAWGGLIDLDRGTLTADDDEDFRAVADRIRTARSGGGGADDELSLRAGTWYAPRLTAVTTLPPVAPDRACRADQWYVMTDATAEVNRPLTERLIEHGARLIVSVTTAGDSFAPLESPGVEVRRLAADAPDLAWALAAATDDGPVAGVVVAPVTATIRPLAQTGADDVVSQLAAARIAVALDEATSTWPLDFFCVLGSAAATWGAIGTTARAAAEGMLEALAADRAQRGQPVQLLRFMPRADTNELSRRDGMLMADSGLQPLTGADVAETFGALLPTGHPNLSVAHVDPARYARVCRDRIERAFLARLGTAPGPAEQARPALMEELRGAPDGYRETRALAFVLSCVGEVLGEAAGTDVDPDHGFFELGMDSVMAMSLRARLERALGVELSPTLTFDEPTPRALTRYLLELVAGAATPVSQPTGAGRTVTAFVPARLDELADLSEDDVAARLSAALAWAQSLLRDEG